MPGQPWLKYQSGDSDTPGQPWLKYQKPAEPDIDPKTSPVTAATTGLVQGGIPFASSLAGAGKAGLDAITGVRGPLAGGNLDDVLQDYRDTRDSFTQDAGTAAQAHPVIALASNVAGGLKNPLFQSAHTLPELAGAAGVQGLGMSKADLTKPLEDSENLKQAGIDTAAGATGGVLGYAASKAIPAIAKGAGWLGKKALTTLGPSEEAINARLAGKAQPDAKSYPELAEQMGGSLKNLKSQIGSASDEARATLSPEKTIPKPYITNSIDDALSALGISPSGDKKKVLIGPTDKKTADVLNSLKSDINELGDNVSEQDLKTLVQKMDDNINWDDQSQDKLNRTLEGLRSKFDGTLKFQNPAYKQAIQPVSQRMAVLDNIRRQFNFKNVPGEGLQPTDTTSSKVQTSLRDNKAVTQGNLDKLRDFTGEDYQDLAKDYQLSQQFENTGPNGARRTVLGGAVGGLLGHGSPGAIGLGAGAGAILDRYGGQAVGGLLDSIVKVGRSKEFGKFEPVIKMAQEKGPEALAVLGSILGTNPEFKQILSRLRR